MIVLSLWGIAQKGESWRAHSFSVKCYCHALQPVCSDADLGIAHESVLALSLLPRPMRLIIWKTFYTLVANDEGVEETCTPRCASFRRHSAPPAVTYRERVVSSEPVAGASKAQRKRQKKKEARARRAKLAADTAAADELVLMESIDKAEEERLLLGTENEPDDDVGKPRRRARNRGVRRRRLSGTKLRFHFVRPVEERPPEAIFVISDKYGEFGFARDPLLCTTALRKLLIDLDEKDWADDYVVTTTEGDCVNTGSTLGEQHVMPGARLRLSRTADDSDSCKQS